MVCPDGIWDNAEDCYEFEGEGPLTSDAGAAQTLWSDCPGGCLKNGQCAELSDKDDCDRLNPNQVDEEDSILIAVVLAVLGVLAAIAIAILLYCFCCKKDDEGDYKRVNDE